MHHSKTLWFFLIGCMVAGLINLSGCAGLTKNENVKEADEGMVKNCQFIGTFNSSFSDPKSALNSAVNEAAEKGATHYLIMDTARRHHAGSLISQNDIRIRAYKCGGSKPTSTKKASKKK